MTPTGLTKDAGWQIGVSRTVPVPLDDVWAGLTSDDGVGEWLGDLGAGLPAAKGEAYRTAGGAQGELRSLRPGDRVRLTYQPPGRSSPTILQVAVTPGRSAGGPSTVVRFHQDHLADAAEREAMRDHWAGVLDRLAARLGW